MNIKALSMNSLGMIIVKDDSYSMKSFHPQTDSEAILEQPICPAHYRVKGGMKDD